MPTLSSPSAVSPTHDPASLAPLIESIGGCWAADACGAQAVFAPADIGRLEAGFVCLLADMGLISARGADALSFLHNQLTNDVEHLPESDARWFGYCSPKGRLLGAMLGWREADGLQLLLPRPQTEPVRRRLSMFVLRAKARLEDASEGMRLLGIGGSAGTQALAALGLAPPGPMQVARRDALTVVGLPAVALRPGDAPVQRWVLALPADSLDAVWQALGETLAPVASTTWRWIEVRSGVPRIVAGAVEQFVPQMVNLELVGGVSFTKGCYPGQEVVARSQYLGKLRRRMFLARTSGAIPDPGTDVLPAAGGEPVGQVVVAAPAPDGGVDLLFEARTDALVEARPCVNGAPLSLQPLPYAVPAP
jgi:folate-binding protein YgfZ